MEADAPEPVKEEEHDTFTVLTEVYKDRTFTVLVQYRPTFTPPPPYGLSATGLAQTPHVEC